MTLEIRPFLTLTTGHVSAATASMLDSTPHKTWPCLGGPYGEYGWFFYVHDENDGTIPDDLWRIMCWAKARDIHYILFDRDADTVDELPTYEW